MRFLHALAKLLKTCSKCLARGGRAGMKIFRSGKFHFFIKIFKADFPLASREAFLILQAVIIPGNLPELYGENCHSGSHGWQAEGGNKAHYFEKEAGGRLCKILRMKPGWMPRKFWEYKKGGWMLGRIFKITVAGNGGQDSWKRWGKVGI